MGQDTLSEITKRKLSAIMFTDIKGFSTQMSQRERGTLKLLDEHDLVLREQIVKFAGTIIKTIGDAFMVDFASAVNAVHCALAIQRALAGRNLVLPDEEHILIRIGIHLGDIYIRGDDIFGDGVNIASRLEAEAEPGGICVSGDIYNQVRDKLNFKARKLRRRRLRNIPTAIEAYQITFDPDEEEEEEGWEEWPAEVAPPYRRRASRRGRLIFLLTLLVLAVAGGGWFTWKEQGFDLSSLHLWPTKPATLVITTTPLNVEVRIDGKLVATQTPYTHRPLQPGQHSVVVSGKGYAAQEESFNLRSGETRRLRFTLEKERYVSIKVYSHPPGAKVLVNGAEVEGVTPLTVDDLLFEGEHRITVVKEGYREFNTTLRLKPGETRRVKAILKPVAAGRGRPREAAPTSDQPAANVGYLSLTSQPPAQVWVDGQNTGKSTPLTKHPLAPGPHTVTLKNPQLGAEQSFPVEITAGETVTVSVK